MKASGISDQSPRGGNFMLAKKSGKGVDKDVEKLEPCALWVGMYR